MSSTTNRKLLNVKWSRINIAIFLTPPDCVRSLKFSVTEIVRFQPPLLSFQLISTDSPLQGSTVLHGESRNVVTKPGRIPPERVDGCTVTTAEVELSATRQRLDS